MSKFAAPSARQHATTFDGDDFFGEQDSSYTNQLDQVSKFAQRAMF
jgi:hypothetical protein